MKLRGTCYFNFRFQGVCPLLIQVAWLFYHHALLTLSSLNKIRLLILGICKTADESTTRQMAYDLAVL